VALFLVLFLAVGTSQATSYSWNGTTSNAWALSTNWTGGTYPNAAGDQATINVSNHNPVSLTTSVTLGASATALTIGSSAGSTALDIAAAGTLNMTGGTGGISNSKVITIEGLLAAIYASGSVTEHYSIAGSGSISLVGGTINGSGSRSAWDINQAVTGYGTLAGKIYDYSTITANSATPITITGTTTMQGGTLAATGSGSFVNNGTITGFGTITAPITTGGTITALGGTLLLESRITGTFTISAKSTGGAEVDLNGADLVGPTGMSAYNTLGNNSSGNAGPIKLTGDSTLENNFQTNAAIGIQVNGNTLTLKNFHGSFTSDSYLDVGTGNLVINGPASIFSGGNIHLGGGNINYTTSSVVDTLQAGVTGYGDVKVELLSVSALASGGTLYIDGGDLLSLPGGTYNNSALSSSAGAVLDVRSTLTTNGQNFTSYLVPKGGIVNLDGATLAAAVGAIGLTSGTVNVTNNSTLIGNIITSSDITINSGKTLDMSAASVSIQRDTSAGNPFGSLTNNGTFVIGGATLDNAVVSPAAAYSLSGSGVATLAGGKITSTGGGGFISTTTLDGYGSVTAPFTNNGKVIADGGTLSFTQTPTGTNSGTQGNGWYAVKKGELTLPTLTIAASLTPATYNWGGATVNDMVNSIQIVFGSVSTPGDLAIALLSSDHPDVPAGLVNPIGVWQFTDPLTFSGATLTFRYDDAKLAASSDTNPNDLKLFGWDGKFWDLIATTINTSTDLLQNTGVGSGQITSFDQYYAIADSAPTPPAVPEPLTLASAFLAISSLGMYLRKRTKVSAV
jgi:hypothetical protein